ncbi:MAG: DUF1295 domain-containing protein [Spirochaetia bacterium]|nr:DUF1295 domain-containing protein [Spirochaetia bacterium]
MLCMTVLWLISIRIKDASIVDAFWGPGFAIVAWIYFAFTNDVSMRKLAVCTLTTLWALRLGIHIFIRNHGKGEDPRYQVWRAEAGKSYWWYSFFKVFLLQGIILIIVSAPLLGAQISPMTFPTPLDGIGILLFMIGLFFETVGDWQLKTFKTHHENKGKVMQTGLWKYTRHPNYFGDALVWWGFFCMAAAAGAWWTIYAPVVMTFFLMKVSGVALLEKAMSVRPGYKEYIARTSAFFPWFPGPRNQ